MFDVGVGIGEEEEGGGRKKRKKKRGCILKPSKGGEDLGLEFDLFWSFMLVSKGHIKVKSSFKRLWVLLLLLFFQYFFNIFFIFLDF